MKPKTQRLVFVLVGLALLSIAAALVILAFDKSLNYFYSPSDIEAQAVPGDRAIQLGGLVKAGSRADDGLTVRFVITDMAHEIAVSYDQSAHGFLPDLFAEGQGVIVEGKLVGAGFEATRVLAKHDENYMPPEVADALKRSGEWRGDASDQAAP